MLYGDAAFFGSPGTLHPSPLNNGNHYLFEGSIMAGNFFGDVDPRAAWDALTTDDQSVLIDVRTQAEWVFVGTPDLGELGREVIKIEWQSFPGMFRNQNFVDQVMSEGLAPERPLYLICRSGARSRQAAILLAQHGFSTYNVADGFEGDLDADGHRGSVSGWKVEKLPWRQS